MERFKRFSLWLILFRILIVAVLVLLVLFGLPGKKTTDRPEQNSQENETRQELPAEQGAPAGN